MANIKVFKLVSGEEIIAKIVSESDTEYTIESARTIIMQQMGGGQLGIGMIPWVVTMPDDQLVLLKSHIMTTNDNIPKPMGDSYLQQVSGIQLTGI